LGTFRGVCQKDVTAQGEYRTKRLILERYEVAAVAVRIGVAFRTPLDPPPGQGPRHPARTLLDGA
jgi:hypothetical protein